jgi:putative tricarboxylic transport membrane protein
MKKANVGIALLLLVVGALVLADALRLGFRWGRSGPQAGFFPFWLAVGLIVCCLIELRRTLAKYRKEGRVGKRLMPEGAWKSIAWVIAPAIGMVVVTELIGLHLAAALYLAFYMRAVGKIGWGVTIVVALAVPTVLYVAFDKLFLVPLPQGLWGAQLMPF